MAPKVPERTPPIYSYPPSSRSSSPCSSYSSSFQPCTVPPNFLASLGESDRRVARYILEQTEEQERVAEARSISKMLVDAVERVGAERKCGGLEASKWATNKPNLGISNSNKHNNINTSSTFNTQPTFFNSHSNPSSSFNAHIGGQTSIAGENTTVQPLQVGTQVEHTSAGSNMASEQKRTAIVDDTDAFMKAIASLPALGSKAPATNGTAETVRLPANVPAETPIEPPMDIQADDVPEEPEVQEDREHQLTFSSWGTPTARTGPAPEIRRIVLTSIPSFLLTPTKVLSLMHGGSIETVSVNTSKQCAEVLFCEAAACKAFYDKYPNGIDVNFNARRGTVFVEMGKEVDVISSRLRESLAVGATRVLRAVGAPLDATLEDMIRMTDKNLKLEKIVDTYEAGLGLRTVTFRFCTIDNAVRFRSVLVRDEAWEQANVQYGPDPCEIATGIHWD